MEEQKAAKSGSWRKWLSVTGFAIIIFVAVAVYLQREQKQQEYVQALEAYARLPEMPLELSYRNAIMGPGLVVSFKNRSGRNLSVAATFTNPTLRQEKAFRVDVPDKGTKEFGHLEGWTFASGDVIKVVHKEYKPLTVTLP